MRRIGFVLLASLAAAVLAAATSATTPPAPVHAHGVVACASGVDVTAVYIDLPDIHGDGPARWHHLNGDHDSYAAYSFQLPGHGPIRFGVYVACGGVLHNPQSTNQTLPGHYAIAGPRVDWLCLDELPSRRHVLKLHACYQHDLSR